MTWTSGTYRRTRFANWPAPWTYLLTVLVPVRIPEHGRTGELLLRPNARPVRRTYLRNLTDKLWLESRLGQRLLAAGWRRGWLRMTRVVMQPGNLYLLWGYRTLHTNAPCDPSHVRATVLLHYLDPHAGSRFARLLRRQWDRRGAPASATPPRALDH